MKTIKFTLLALCVLSINCIAQTQKGLDIDGEVAFDESGSSVSMPDANTLAIGAGFNSGSAASAGHVRIYTWNGTTWVQKGLDIDGESGNDRSRIVSMPDANTVAIGANLNDGNGTDAGHVRVYIWDGATWVQKGLDIDGEAAGDWFGSSISMPDANTLAIGAPLNDGNGSSSGHARVYIWNGTAWIQKGGDIDGEVAGDRLGWSVSMPDANTIAVGANSNDGNGTSSGHARIYVWNGITWVQKGGDIDGEAAGDGSGLEVSMPDANTIAIGAINNDGNGSNAGHVRVFTWDGINWIQDCIDIDGEAAFDNSGFSISMPDGNTIAVGARFNDGNGSNAGHVRVYNCGVVLPIELLSFEAIPENDNHVKLNWTTSTEINNDFFTLERSTDAVNFEQVKVRQGAGNSNTIIDYVDYDKNPYQGTSYYRLKQTDFNGDFSYSNIRSVFFNSLDIINLYPNPTQGQLILSVGSSSNNVITINLIDVLGRTLLTEQHEVVEGTTTIRLNIAHLVEGTYVLKAFNNKGSFTKKQLIKTSN